MVLKEYKIGDICIISAGGDAPLNAFSKNKTSEFSVPIYSNGVVDEGLYGYTNSAKIKDPAITLSARGTIGISFRRFEPYFPIVRLISLVIKDTQIVDIDYLYYASKFLHIEKDGSVQQQLTIPQVSELRVKLPDLPTQKKIAKVLSDIDTKLSLNRRINERLEQVARQLYDYWFVQFDFPDANGNPYRTLGGKMIYNDKLKREIPEGWEVKRLEQIEPKIITGKTPSTKDSSNFIGRIPFVTIDDIRKSTYITSTERHLSQTGADKQKGQYILEDSLCCSCIGTVGEIGFTTCLSQTNQQINSIVFEKWYNKIYLYYALKMFFEKAVVKTSNTFKNMSKGEFSDILITEPPIPIRENFQHKLGAIFDKLKRTKQESDHLTALRDRLLPLLMNGQVTIKE